MSDRSDPRGPVWAAAAPLPLAHCPLLWIFGGSWALLTNSWSGRENEEECGMEVST